MHMLKKEQNWKAKQEQNRLSAWLWELCALLYGYKMRLHKEDCVLWHRYMLDLHITFCFFVFNVANTIEKAYS